MASICKILNPCWVFSSMMSLCAAILIFCFFGFAGKTYVFSRNHNLTKWESLWVPSFWSMDKTFFIFGTIFLMIIIWLLYVFRFLWDLLYNPEKRKNESKKDFLLKVLDLYDTEKKKKKNENKKKQLNNNILV